MNDGPHGDADGVHPATPGSYGLPPAGERLPEATRLGPVRLQVADLDRSTTFYRDVLGLRVVTRTLRAATLAPQDDDSWRCRPELKHGPTVAVKTEDNPRLFPVIQRNSSTYDKLRRLRSGTERSNSVKKGPHRLVEARHRRQSFWLIRLHLIGMLQHARAWGASVNASAWVDSWLQEVCAVAA